MPRGAGDGFILLPVQEWSNKRPGSYERAGPRSNRSSQREAPFGTCYAPSETRKASYVTWVFAESRQQNKQLGWFQDLWGSLPSWVGWSRANLGNRINTLTSFKICGSWDLFKTPMDRWWLLVTWSMYQSMEEWACPLNFQELARPST